MLKHASSPPRPFHHTLPPPSSKQWGSGSSTAKHVSELPLLRTHNGLFPRSNIRRQRSLDHDRAQGNRPCLTHLPLPTSHGNIHKPPSVGDSLLCTAFGSVMDLDRERKDETEQGGGDMRLLLLLGLDLPSPDSSAFHRTASIGACVCVGKSQAIPSEC